MKIALLGDIAFFGKFSLKKNENLYDYFKSASVLLSDYDYVIGNLETPFVINEKSYGAKSANIKSDPENVKLLKYLNIGIVNLANNHVFDYGNSSFQLTKRILIENEIQYFGIEEKQVYLSKNKVKIALHGYCCYSTNPLGIGKGVNRLDITDVENNLMRNHNNGFFNIIACHCGQEHVHTPNYQHLRMARQFTENCPYVFYGHHPHVIQGIENLNNSLLAYSLGNFCFDDVYTEKSKEPLIRLSEANKNSYILEIEFSETGIINSKIIPTRMGENELIINDTKILKDVEKYSIALQEEKETYISKRQVKLSNYLASRKELRDFKWYLKRLNFSSVRIIFAAIRNNKLFKNSISKKLKPEKSRSIEKR